MQGAIHLLKTTTYTLLLGLSRQLENWVRNNEVKFDKQVGETHGWTNLNAKQIWGVMRQVFFEWLSDEAFKEESMQIRYLLHVAHVIQTEKQGLDSSFNAVA